MSRSLMRAVMATALLGYAAPAFAATDSQAEINDLKAEIKKQEAVIQKLEGRVDELEQQQAAAPASASPAPEPAGNAVQSNDNAFNPAISAVLDGHYAAYSGHDVPIGGFAGGDDSGRASQGLGVDEAEIGLSSNVDDKFAAAVTASASEADGNTSLSLEEAYIRTLGLPGGLGVKVGRFLEPIGYINEHHEHTDDFADRPLPNRIFLNNSYKDDGVLASWILPTDHYAEVGAGAFHGGDFPASGDHGSSPGAWLAYARTGGDIGENQNWLFGLSTVQAKPHDREGNDGTVSFTGDSDLYAASLRYLWDPTGNSELQEVTLQGEYFWRHEKGTYNDTAAATGDVPFDGNQSGWYAQGVYKFAPQWRVGTRFSMLNAADAPAGLANSALDDHGHDPWNAALMGDWTNSEFSRIRLQYEHEEPAVGKTDNQFLLQYVVSIGAHPAHTF